LEKWAPDLYTVLYTGSTADKSEIEKYEIRTPGQPCRAEVVLTPSADVKAV
jgi:hypothetical protein